MKTVVEGMGEARWALNKEAKDGKDKEDIDRACQFNRLPTIRVMDGVV